MSGPQIFVFGTATHDGLVTLIRYSTSSRSWTHLAQIPTPTVRGFAAVAALGIGSYCFRSLFVGGANLCGPLRSDSELVITAMRQVRALVHFPPGLLPLMASFLGLDSIFVVGGYSGRPLPTSVCYSLDSGTWRSNVGSMDTARYAAASVAIGGRMMVFGGFSYRYLATCESFDLTTNEWSELPPMSTSRSNASAIVWQGRAFVFGGHNSSGVLSSAECFDPIANCWSAIAPMCTPRYYASGVAVPGRGLLLMGGHDGFSPVVESAELYDPATNKWTLMPWQLPKAVFDLAAHCIDRMLYVLGGCTSDGTRSCECWSMDLDVAIWSPLPPLPTTLAALASALV